MPARSFQLALLSSLALSCGTISTDPSSPEPTNAQRQCQGSCNSGCCTTTGECVAGTAESSCGRGGDPCQACASPQRCESSAAGGACRPCSQLNCDGCCTLEGACRSGTADDACGSAGKTCVSCDGSALCTPTGVGGGTCG